MAPPAAATSAVRPGRAASPAQRKQGAAAPADENAPANVRSGAGLETPRGAEVAGAAVAKAAPVAAPGPMGWPARVALWALLLAALALSAASGYCLGAREPAPCARVIDTVRSAGAEAGIEGVACVVLMCAGPLVFRLVAWTAQASRKCGAVVRKGKAD
ncbi:unnamed protein product [Prorocentrum cordatum]|uniref:Uncharacterized protein n=1 Tax=Prorocentrum cordatum TaxID=2364126 RepID=A0ABN9VHX9_9DINO|nr:unnamed protein product [Polarella glacialis]